MKEYLEISDQNVIKALAHPLRVQILGILETRAASPNELSRNLVHRSATSAITRVSSCASVS